MQDSALGRSGRPEMPQTGPPSSARGSGSNHDLPAEKGSEEKVGQDEYTEHGLPLFRTDGLDHIERSGPSRVSDAIVTAHDPRTRSGLT